MIEGIDADAYIEQMLIPFGCFSQLFDEPITVN
jgi:hypothetical protein